MNDQWMNVDSLREQLLRDDQLRQYYANITGGEGNKSEIQPLTRDDIMIKLETVALDMMEKIREKAVPSLTLSRRSWADVRYTEGVGLNLQENGATTALKFSNLQQVKKLTLIVRVLPIIYELVQTNQYSTKRDIFYKHPGAFGCQGALDEVVCTISRMLAVPRWHLHVLATSKGLIAGHLRFTDSEDVITDCIDTTVGVPVPNHIGGIQMQSDAKVILVIEKDATFQKLLDCQFHKKMGPCILVTGKGVPDINTRLLLKKLWESLRIPVLALVDADPYGLEIMMIYKYGSLSLSYEARNLALPSLRWLGILPTDITKLKIPAEGLLPLTTNDSRKASLLLQRPYVQQDQYLKNEIEHLLRLGQKTEIQGLCSISTHFLTDVYLPSKIKFGGWI